MAEAGPERTDKSVQDVPPQQGSSYDKVPYSVHAFPQTRPDHLGVIAKLFGMNPARPDRCRVLELGCASGGNLIPMALAWPEAQYVGIDLSGRQIDDGRRVVRELGLCNLDLRAMSILDVDDDFGQFDYILCHGVYSWVPPAVQDKILAICRDRLRPQGVAYVSYNTYPGWHARGAIREMMCYHTERFEDPADRLREARGLLGFLAKSVPALDGGYGALIRQEIAVLLATPDTYLLHEHLEDYNQPLYFHQFMSRAAAKDLQYLGESQIGSMIASRLGPDAEETLRQISPDLLHMEQYMDFLRNRMFRQTLLCHANIELDHRLRSEAVRDIYVASAAGPVSERPDVQSDASEKFSVEGGLTLETHDRLMKAAMVHLAERWPGSARFDELLNAARDRAGVDSNSVSDDATNLSTRLLNCFVSNIAEFSLHPPGFLTKVTDRPVASPYARLRAKEGGQATNYRLEVLPLSEPSRLMLMNLDGEHDRASLVALVTDWIERNEAKLDAALGEPTSADQKQEQLAPAQRAERYVDELLKGFARSAVLVG